MEKIRQSWWLVALLACAVPGAMAGPPLLCHPFNIGEAKSLPWQQAAGGWNAPRADYDTRQLASDTLALLSEDLPVIVRMETLRRAALYGARERDAVDALLRKLELRANADAKRKTNALALFDYGYLLETMKQVSAIGEANPPARDGYPLIKEALRMRGNDPAMEFAAALVTTWPKRPEHEEHLRKAVAGASSQPLLAENVRKLSQ